MPPNLGQMQNAGAGHGDYWGGGKEIKPHSLSCARVAAREVHDYLQFASTGEHHVAPRPLLEFSTIAARELAGERNQADRQLFSYGG